MFPSKTMLRCRILLVALSLLLGAHAAFADSREIVLPHGNLELTGKLEIAPGKTLADGAVLMLHGNMAHADMEIMRMFRSQLRKAGFTTLAINLSLNQTRRQGMQGCDEPLTHRVEDALPELGAWLDWLAQQGARGVTLLGFSRGGHQVAWFLAARPHPLVRSAVLLAPLVGRDGTAPERYQARYGKPLEPLLQQARAHAAAGNANALLDQVGFLSCPAARVSAAAFLSHYALAEQHDTPALLPRTRVPTLIVVAGGDEIARDTEARFRPRVDDRRLQMVVVPGADHFFNDLFGEDAAEAVVAFLREQRGNH
ncbi:MAG: alpha/beta hydrolase [Rhodocyclaceae bacterium]|nr:alpha/beta hydrolase [Rhodocyclaceae bacterium]